MKKLTHQDFQTLLASLAILYSNTSQTTLEERLLTFMTGIISSDIHSFDFFSTDGDFTGKQWSNADIIPTSEQLECLSLYSIENPTYVKVVLEKSRNTSQTTDFLSIDQFKRTNVYNEFYRYINAEVIMLTNLPISDNLDIICTMTRNGTAYSERDTMVMSLITPHLINAITNTFDFERLNVALETKDCGVIAFNGDGKAQYISEFARQLLVKYFPDEKREDNSLPEILWNWINQNSFSANEFTLPATPFKIQNENGELSIRLMNNSTTKETTLMLEEKKHPSPKMLEKLNLTKREAEILFWMAQGKADGDIGIICNISTYTVYKHAQHIYKKLGVETRTAAMLRALEIL